ncbi:VOC family protein [Sansalvadorimonas sp. 2012CJ34-2]|uniref:VOC family protein n=1 Tax=Parendozoicomonas callyspongiae TaxID=2942213 RepID=A0ABT0PHC1_9GAMM|nr:VOC family protein [Sansalvadorimonas sp. 2012CJ34-2]MCL6270651.1 VOC family protein [Sansalvadorimonas sp. 2012CJ34-2]
MNIHSVAGMAVISADTESSATLYCDVMGLDMKTEDDYRYTNQLDGAKHFGIWSLNDAANACYGTELWPDNVPVPQTTIEFEFRDTQAVADAVNEMKEKGYTFVHDVRMEPWGQTLARFISPEGVLIGLSYAPWQHGDEQK